MTKRVAFAVFVMALALAGCDSQNPTPRSSNATGTPPAGSGQPTTTTPSLSGGGSGLGTGTGDRSAPPSPTTTVQTPATDAPGMPGSATRSEIGRGSSPPVPVPPKALVDGTRVAAVPQGEAAVSLDRLVGRSLDAGQITLQLNADRTFRLHASESGGKVEGTYAVQDDILTFAEPRGAIGGVEFPMRCRVAQAGETLQLASIGDSCRPLHGLLFR